MITGSVLERLSYDPETGIFVWVNPPNHNAKLKDQIAGTIGSDGYRRIRIGGRAYIASRLACVWMLGKWPDEEMDHINRDPSDDRWENLREATSSLNKINRSGGIDPNGNPWERK